MLRPIVGVGALLFAFSVSSTVQAQTFRVETDVFEGSKKEPICQTLTLFTDGLVYDLVLDKNGAPTEIAIFDMSSSRVVLLNVAASQKAVLTLEDLMRATTAMKVEIPADAKLFHFAANPKFAVEFSPESKELKLRGDPISYTVKAAKSEQPAAADSYREYADWSARLNSMRPGNLPPFARMEVSRELADRDLLPEEIVRTIVVPGRIASKKLEVRSKHHVNWITSTKDRQRIRVIADQIGDFRAVSFQEFIGPEKVASKK